MEAIFRKRKRPILFRACKKSVQDVMIKLPSSVQEVMSNDDLLFEILLRLPVTALHVFKLVSKHWLSLIIDTNFTQHRSQFKIDPPSGLFLEKNGYDLLVSLDLGVKSSLQNNFVRGSLIEQSCNGLLLCRILPNKLYVYNPTTNKFKMLPEHHSVNYYPLSISEGTRLAFDPTKSPHYKVVHAGLINEAIQILIYSSETGNWSDHGDRFPSCRFDCFKDGIYWNGSINWLNKLEGYGLLHSKLDITHHPVLTTIENLGIMDGKYFCDCNLFESRGYLLFLGVECCYPKLVNVYEMRNGSSGWNIRYRVDVDDIAIFPARSLMLVKCWVRKIVWWIVLGEKEEDSYMVIRFDRRVVKYKMALKSYRVLRYLKPHSPPVPQFIASYAHV